MQQDIVIGFHAQTPGRPRGFSYCGLSPDGWRFGRRSGLFASRQIIVRRDAQIVRVIVRELGTKPAKASRKQFVVRIDSVGPCCTVCVGV